MIIYLLVCITCVIGSGLTLFSGFGLGTILLPVFGIFFPVEIAIALNAIVHFLNNLFKLFLVAKHANKWVVLKFGLPSIIAAIVGALALSYFQNLSPIYSYTAFNHSHVITPIKLIIAFILILFCLVELIPSLSKIGFDSNKLIIGGLLSGFFGGLSGNQGALRTAFLSRAGLSKESFIATGVVIACLVDISRLSVYANTSFSTLQKINVNLTIAATLSAFAGAFIGNKLIKKISLTSFKIFVASALFLFAIGMALGFI